MKTLVFQSAPERRPGWINMALESVRKWADVQGSDYRLLGDECFDVLPPDLRKKFEAQKVVMSDLARIILARTYLEEGFDQVVWADADFLVFDPEALFLPEEKFAFGREVWIEEEKGRLRARSKVHNAFMMFRSGNPFLDWYIHAARRLLERAEPPVVPQFIGPKFLSSQHNLIGLPEIQSAAMFSPPVLRDVLFGGGAARDLMLFHQGCLPGGANLSHSLVGQAHVPDGLTNVDMEVVVSTLLQSTGKISSSTT